MRKGILYFLIVCCAFIVSCSELKEYPDRQSRTFEQEVVYHIFQRSFYDSNGDRHGDLNGIRAKLDYLEDLGVNTILITPLYLSPFYHNYFPDDFYKIDPTYGSLEDYLELQSKHISLYPRGIHPVVYNPAFGWF